MKPEMIFPIREDEDNFRDAINQRSLGGSMVHLSHHARVTAVVVTFIFAPAITYLGPALDGRRSCERFTEWAVTRPNMLPRDIAELAAFPESGRRAIFSKLSSDTMANIWTEQLLNFKTTRSLTTEQRDLIDRVLTKITPSLYAPADTEEKRALRAAASQIGRDARSVLGERDAQVLFQLGYGVRPNYGWASFRFAVTEAVRDLSAAYARPDAFYCECSAWLGDCYFPFSGPCYLDNECQPTWGCGPIGFDFCDGLCT